MQKVQFICRFKLFGWRESQAWYCPTVVSRSWVGNHSISMEASRQILTCLEAADL